MSKSRGYFGSLFLIIILLATSVSSFAEMDGAMLAAKIHSDLKTIDAATKTYFKENGVWPKSISDLTSSGFLKTVPTPPTDSGIRSYSINHSYAKYPNNFDDTDTTKEDGAIISEGSLNDEICATFNEIVGLPRLVHDNTRPRETYPGVYSCVTWDDVPNNDNEIIVFYAID